MSVTKEIHERPEVLEAHVVSAIQRYHRIFEHNHSKKSVNLFHFFPTPHATLTTNGASVRNGPHSSKMGENGRSEASVEDESRGVVFRLVKRFWYKH
jgi:hypothetical protein